MTEFDCHPHFVMDIVIQPVSRRRETRRGSARSRQRDKRGARKRRLICCLQENARLQLFVPKPAGGAGCAHHVILCTSPAGDTERVFRLRATVEVSGLYPIDSLPQSKSCRFGHPRPPPDLQYTAALFAGACFDRYKTTTPAGPHLSATPPTPPMSIDPHHVHNFWGASPALDLQAAAAAARAAAAAGRDSRIVLAQSSDAI